MPRRTFAGLARCFVLCVLAACGSGTAGDGDASMADVGSDNDFAGSCADDFEDSQMSLCPAPPLPPITIPGNGNFAASRYQGFGAPCGLAVADFDDNGTIDIIASVLEAPGGTVLANNGDGTFTQRIDKGNWRAMKVVDLRCDGAPDLLAVGGGCGNGQLISLYNVGLFTFAQQNTETVCNPAGVELADLDADGDLDAVVYGYSMSVHDGSDRSRHCALKPAPIYTNGLRAGDFDLNGTIDIVFAEGDGFFFAPGDGARAFYERDNSGDVNWNTIKVEGATPQTIVEDINADGNIDLLSADTVQRTIIVRLAGSDFPLTGGTVVSPNTPERIAVADVNADGLNDILSAGGGEVRVLINEGDGSFTDQGVAATVPGSVHQITTADFNGDGAADFAVCAGDTVSVHLAQTSAP